MPQPKLATSTASSLLNWLYSPRRPLLSLTRIFLVWKLLLLCIVLLSPGEGYDTSTSLLLSSTSIAASEPLSWPTRLVKRLVSRLVRWDSIYMTQIAARGYTYEQEWAFGYGYTRFLGYIYRSLGKVPFVKGLSETEGIAMVGIVLSHVTHWWSVFLCYDVSKLVFSPIGARESEIEGFAVLSAMFHILSPAGVFLSAPYAESLFAMLTFGGAFWYARARIRFARGDETMGAIWIFGCGLVFGLSTLMRGNGLLSGLTLVYELGVCLQELLRLSQKHEGVKGSLTKALSARTIVIGLSGVAMALIASWPQFRAYQDFCSGQEEEVRRPWCSASIPSIFTFVQAENWGVGLFQYWSVSNLPLFFIAAPMILTMVLSGVWAWRGALLPEPKGSEEHRMLQASKQIIRGLAVPQIVLALLALTTYHVQIITRLSSAYPIGYWWLASLVANGSRVKVFGRERSVARIIIQWMVIYGMIQTGLFASFLPPA